METKNSKLQLTPEAGKSPDKFELLGSFPITGRISAGIQVTGSDRNPSATVFEFEAPYSLEENEEDGFIREKRTFRVLVDGNVGHYEDNGVVDIVSATKTAGSFTNGVTVAIIRDPKGAFMHTGILIPVPDLD